MTSVPERDADPHAPDTAPPGGPLLSQRAGATFVASEATFATEYGGLLFLLNAFIALGLYPDFTQPFGARLNPSPLWLAHRIGRYWFGARYARDPLARWCAAHGASGALPRNWRIEPSWLDGFDTSRAPGLERQRGRITLWHADGFPLRDAARYRPPIRVRRLTRPPRHLPRPGPNRWIACLALYLEARLRRLTGDGLDLLARHARIGVRDLDLAATFALDRHPIQLRLAGLDRNPGWQPAEGRAIAFAFA